MRARAKLNLGMDGAKFYDQAIKREGGRKPRGAAQLGGRGRLPVWG